MSMNGVCCIPVRTTRIKGVAIDDFYALTYKGFAVDHAAGGNTCFLNKSRAGGVIPTFF